MLLIFSAAAVLKLKPLGVDNQPDIVILVSLGVFPANQFLERGELAFHAFHLPHYATGAETAQAKKIKINS